MKRPYHAVVVTWHDAWQESDEEIDPQDIEHEPAVQVLIGWLIRRDKKGITVATEYSEEDGRIRTRNFIPGRMVVRVEKI